MNQTAEQHSSRHTTDQRAILAAACKQAGLSAEPAALIRDAENAMWRLPNKIVARISRPGQGAAARREVAVAQWLADEGVPAVHPHPHASGPLFIGDRTVSFWEELPEHRRGTPTETARLLRQLHALPIPHMVPPLPGVEPFVRLSERIIGITVISEQERDWLRGHLDDLAAAWADLPPGSPQCVVHGDAWVGNVAVPDDGVARLLDFERTTLGPPEWDLASTAVSVDLFPHVSATEYESFCLAYGADVTEWEGYPTLRDIRELRVTLFALQVASDYPVETDRARLRLECLLGLHGPRPWHWPVVH